MGEGTMSPRAGAQGYAYKDVALKLLDDHKLEPMPVPPYEKYPKGIANWNGVAIDRAWVKGHVTNGKSDFGVAIRLQGAGIGVDVDVYNRELASALVKHLSALVGEKLCYRVGQAPKFLVPFTCPAIQKRLESKKYIDQTGKAHKIEILTNGSQYMAFGLHPGTREPYRWHNGDPTTAGEGPEISKEEVEDLIAYFEEEAEARGWELAPEATEKEGGTLTKDSCISNITKAADFHVSTRDLARHLAKEGKDEAEAIAFIEGLYDQVPDDRRDPQRYDKRRADIGRAVTTAIKKITSDGSKVHGQRSKGAIMQMPTNTAQIIGEEGWPEPEPINRSVPSDPYPIQHLPKLMRDAVEEVQATVKAPLAMVASSALGTLSAVSQGHVDVRRDPGLEGPSSLNIIQVSDSGERKTTVDKKFAGAIDAYDEEIISEKELEVIEFRANHAAWDAERKGLLQTIKNKSSQSKSTLLEKEALRELEAREPKEPRVPSVRRGDDTPENLAYDLVHRWPVGAVISSEAGVVFGSTAMSEGSVMRNLSQLNILWDGGSLPIGRRTSKSFTVRNVRLSMALQVQRSTLIKFLENTGSLARGSGFLARFLISYPESTQGTRIFTPAADSFPKNGRFTKRIAGLLSTPLQIDDQGGIHPLMLELNPGSKALWVGYHDDIEVLLGQHKELYDIRDVASKTADNAARIAANFHVLQNGKQGEIEENTMADAIVIANWHLTESRRLFGEINTTEFDRDISELDSWILDFSKEIMSSFITKSELLQRGPTRFRKADTLNKVLADLERMGRIAVIKEGRKEIIEVNPELITWETWRKK